MLHYFRFIIFKINKISKEVSKKVPSLANYLSLDGSYVKIGEFFTSRKIDYREKTSL